MAVKGHQHRFEPTLLPTEVGRPQRIESKCRCGAPNPEAAPG